MTIILICLGIVGTAAACLCNTLTILRLQRQVKFLTLLADAPRQP